jgi:hypothetical protein
METFHTERRTSLGRRTIKRRPGKTATAGKDIRLAEEIDYIQGRAADHDGRPVTVGPLVLFSTETGDAWLLDPADHLAARLVRDGDPEDVYFEETEATFAISWKGNYQIDGDAFVYIDRDTARVTTILGYPTRRLAQSA